MNHTMVAFAAAGMAAVAMPASAATIVVTGASQATATEAVIDMMPTSAGGASFASASADILVSSPATANRFFNLTYMFTAPISGSGTFNFVTSSAAPAALKILGFAIGTGAYQAVTATTATVNGVTTTSFSGSAPLELVAGSSQSFSVIGSIQRTGSIGTVASFAAAIPELSTWLMMIMGIGVVGTALRVRRRRVSYSFA